MSIMLDAPLLRPHEIAKSKHGEPKTSSILLISIAITLAIVLLMYAGLSYTEGTMKQYSACRDKGSRLRTKWNVYESRPV